jgi:cyclopropane fatty-acyl-phospholipid synthase-like methyltransferase
MKNPKISSDFDRAYRAPITVWGDTRIPREVSALARSGAPHGVLELGCGTGRLSRYVAQQGVRVTGVDFSSVAIAKARERVANDDQRPEFTVADVTDLDQFAGPFDAIFDVGCFHCLDAGQQTRYVSEVFRLLAPDGRLLIWALDTSPSGLPLTPETVSRTFGPRFDLRDARTSRRRIAKSHWYWLQRPSGSLA